MENRTPKLYTGTQNWLRTGKYYWASPLLWGGAWKDPFWAGRLFSFMPTISPCLMFYIIFGSLYYIVMLFVVFKYRVKLSFSHCERVDDDFEWIIVFWRFFFLFRFSEYGGRVVLIFEKLYVKIFERDSINLNCFSVELSWNKFYFSLNKK